jgi:hypothetical protein
MRTRVGFVAVVIAAWLLPSTTASGSGGRRVFYLAVHPRQCLIATSSTGKHPFLVPCSNSKHNFEVYALGHGGWGHNGPPPYKTALAAARSICVSAFQRLTGHAMASTQGWNASWPDPGSESARYGDKIVCNYRAWPKAIALGSGWHVR